MAARATTWSGAAAGDDTLLGSSGDDTLTGGLGADAIDGGAGINTASYADATARVTIDLSGARTARAAKRPETRSPISSASFGSAFADSLGGGAGSETILGGAGDDTLRGSAGARHPAMAAAAPSMVDYSASCRGHHPRARWLDRARRRCCGRSARQHRRRDRLHAR